MVLSLSLSLQNTHSDVFPEHFGKLLSFGSQVSVFLPKPVILRLLVGELVRNAEF